MKEVNQEFDAKMQKTIEVVMSDFASVRPGGPMPPYWIRSPWTITAPPPLINQVAAISSPDPRSLMIQPWDATLLKAIEKAIQTSDLGINPQNDGRVIRLAFPQLTEERRKELTKQVKKYGENGKVAIRNIRRDAMDKFKAMEKKSEITEDDRKEYEKGAPGYDRRSAASRSSTSYGILKPKAEPLCLRWIFERLPRHVAIIMDGNGRWAKARPAPYGGSRGRGGDLPYDRHLLQGYRPGYLTVYAFSTENWKRPRRRSPPSWAC